jgi:UDP-N-acetylglucosamine transferase subunit ALG13
MTLVVFTVGTDHHPFDRLVGMADAVARLAASGVATEVFVQYGTSAAPTEAAGQAYLPGDDLADWIARADVVVTHGGPATIMGVRDAGRMPVVVPRDPTRGEHVDEHQQRFVRRLAEQGSVLHVESADELLEIVRAVAAGSRSLAAEADRGSVRDTVQLVGSLIDALVDVRRGRTA